MNFVKETLVRASNCGITIIDVIRQSIPENGAEVSGDSVPFLRAILEYEIWCRSYESYPFYRRPYSTATRKIFL